MATASILLLAGTFALAGLAKLRDPAPFRATVALVVAGPRRVALLARAVPLAELALAAWLLSGVAARAAGVASLLLLAAFTLALGAVAQRTAAAEADAVIPCNCFGAGAGGDVAEGRWRNAALGLVALLLAALAPSGRPDVEEALGGLTVAIGAACAWQLALALLRERRAEVAR